MKLAITHSKKIPGAEDYSSEGFSATFEVEVPDQQSQDAVQQWLQELYDQAKLAVEEQIKTVPRRNGNQKPVRASGLFGRGNGNQPTSRAGNGQGVATPKQISFLVSLGAKNKLAFADLQRMAQERFCVEDLYQLDRGAASTLIEELKSS